MVGGAVVLRDVAALTDAEREKAILEQANELYAHTLDRITTAIWPRWRNLGVDAGPPAVRGGGVKATDVKWVGDGVYTFTAKSEFAGVPDLLTRLSLQTDGRRPYLAFPVDRSALPEVQNGVLKVYIEPISKSLDAYPKYLELFEGGLDIAVHVGSDENEPRLDIPHAHSLYDHLVSKGFKSPVPRFDALAIDSPPLQRTIRVKGADVPVRVRILHELMAPPIGGGKLLIDAFKASTMAADVVIYDGHSYGGYPALWLSSDGSRDRANDLFLAKEFRSLDVPNKQQIYFFNGCHTYSTYADAVYGNPKRTEQNTDVITALGFVTMFPEARPVMAFIDALVGIPKEDPLPADASWVPNSFNNILSRLGDGEWDDAYGVHGLDDNPRLSPLADVSVFGRSCREDADCGGTDSECVDHRCGLACADSEGCPGGAVCAFSSGQCAK